MSAARKLKSVRKPVIAVTPRSSGVSGRHSDNTDPSSGVKPAQNEVARSVAEVLSGSLVRDVVDSEWYQRKGETFRRVPEATAKQIVRETLEQKIPQYSYGYLSGVYNFVRDDLMVKQWTDSIFLIPLENGVLDLSTRKVRRYEESDKFRTRLPIRYDSEAKCPQTVAILMQLAGDDTDLFNMMIACMWAVLMRRHDLQKYFELIGPGGTGKSTLIELLTSLVGECNRAVTDLKELEQNRFESATLYQKYLIIITDSARYGGDVAKLKAITGGDPLRNEVKNKQQGEPFYNTAIVFIAANEPISSRDYTTGLSRRRTPIHLDHIITEEEKRRYPNGVSQVFKDELAGILNLLLAQDASEMVKRITNPSDSMQAAKLETELATNPLLRWADEFLVPVNEGQETPTGNKDASPNGGLYANYCFFCDGENLEPVSLQRFGNLLEQQLISRGVVTKRTRTSVKRFFERLGLRHENNTSDPTLLSRHSMTGAMTDESPAVRG